MVVNGDAYVLKKDYCEYGFKFLLQTIHDFFAWFPWIWTRIRPFRGKIIRIEKNACYDTHGFHCSALLIRNEKGEDVWHACFFYPYYKVKPGEIVFRELFGAVYVLRGSQKIKLKRIY